MALRALLKIILILIVWNSDEAYCADIKTRFQGNSGVGDIIIEGEIQKGDFERFRSVIDEHNGAISNVHIFSPGGDFMEAIKIGKAMRALELTSFAPVRGANDRPVCGAAEMPTGIMDIGDAIPRPMNDANCICASACFFIHVGGSARYGNYLLIHRPYYEQRDFGSLSEANAKQAFGELQAYAQNYMREMDVPEHIQQEVLGTSSDKSILLDQRAIELYFSGDLPYRHEWIQSRCRGLNDVEQRKLKDYTARITESDPEMSRFSDAEVKELLGLQLKVESEDKCAIAIKKEIRRKAYFKYFGKTPNGIDKHQYALWSEATRYLGRRFDSILEKETFQEKLMYPYRMLVRPATATAPQITLSDSDTKANLVVRMVSVVSLEEPLPEFETSLVKSLDAAWGEASAGDTNSRMLWKAPSFTAELIFRQPSGVGPKMTLIIEENSED